MKPIEVLNKHWGYPNFRPGQQDAINALLSGNDVLALMPTGGGKSITFQVPGLILPGITIVVTPLISLMKDQVDNLRSHGINATYIHSGLMRGESRLAIQKAQLEKIKFLYISPERLTSEHFRDTLKTLNIHLIVVDEAHCISQWGYDFRPPYLKIATLRTIFPQARMMALTASATPDVVTDITTQLQFRPGYQIFQRSFARPNINYIVRNYENKTEMLLRVLNNTQGSAIVYVRSRTKTLEIAAQLNAQGLTAHYYHAGLAPEEKETKQNDWKTNKVRIIVATNAFGMGIDKPDVRTVIHTDLPSSIEEYYQEAGRAGRDGKTSYAVTIVNQHDKQLFTRRLNESFPPIDYIRSIYQQACLFIDLSLGEGHNQTFDFNFGQFINQHHLQENTARSALRLLTLAGYIEFVEDIDARARIMIICRRHELYNHTLTDNEETTLEHILRTYPGIFADYVNIQETSIAFATTLSTEQTYQALLSLARKHIIHYIPRRLNPYLYFPSRRIQAKHIQLPPNIYDQRRQQLQHRLDKMKQLIFNTQQCRAQAILQYFGENNTPPCNTCDVCRSQRTQPPLTPIIIDQIRQAGPQGLPINAITQAHPHRTTEVTNTLRTLLANKTITLSPSQTHLHLTKP